MGMISLSDFSSKMHTDGYCLFENFIGQKLIDRVLIDLQKSYLLCRKIQLKNGIENSKGTAHHLIGQGESFLDCLAEYEKLNPYLETYFGGKYILNSFGGNLLKKGQSYANAIHRDQRSFSDSLPLMLNTIVMLDNFTAENGATWLMESGHLLEKKPEKDYFDLYAIQAIAPAGSLMVFNSNLWHRAGQNKGDKPRRSITPIFSRPFIKPGFDYSQFVSDKGCEYFKQMLGYYSRVPHTLQEWYQPREKRFYQEGQG